jgi:DNA-binding CsgD family transcriptional regulator
MVLALRALELDEPRNVAYLVALYRGVLGFVELARGRHQQGLDWLEPAHRMLVEQGWAEPGLFRYVPDQVECLLAIGRHDDAEATLAPYLAAAQRLERRSALAGAARASGLLLAARGDPDAALVELDRAVQLEQELGRPFEEARAELARGSLARRSRHKALARESFGRAVQMFELTGSRPWAQRAREQLARVTARRPAALGLTPTEREIAELLAAGCSNPEIATKLFISRKTVERHLTNVYQRLGLRTRAELAAVVATGGWAPHPD